jgi:hypothetical protein
MGYFLGLVFLSHRIKGAWHNHATCFHGRNEKVHSTNKYKTSIHLPKFMRQKDNKTDLKLRHTIPAVAVLNNTSYHDYHGGRVHDREGM